MLELKRRSELSDEIASYARTVLFCLGYAALMTFAGEILSRRSVIRTAMYLISRPHAFAYNALIAALTLSPALFVRRRVFAYTLGTVLWAVLYIADMITRMLRITPFSAYDAFVFFKNLDITNSYVTLWQVALIALGIAAVLTGLVWLYKRAPKVQPKRRAAAVFAAVLASCVLLSTAVYEPFNRDYTDPVKGFNKGGFAYSFLRSFVDRGIDKPEEYDEKTIDDIRSEVESQPQTKTGECNFVFLQLESFVDPALFHHVSCLENPVPHFTRLKKECSAGYLHVPMIGGGTANVEFEVITGMRLHDFGTGEYPYTTILQSETCETVAYDLKTLGYTAHAIHNNTGSFYNRHQVLPMLGFDTFTSLEYMQNVTSNALGWCRDEVLTGCILDALNSTPGEDLVFAVSVQGHGKYASDAPETPYPIGSTGLEEDESEKNAFEYYINQLHETDAFIGQLTEALEAYPEPVVLVLYGDHLPPLSVEESDLKTGSLLMTEYVMWSNDGSLPKQDGDLSAYQLTACTLQRKGIGTGPMMLFHQRCRNNEDYLEELSALAYDMLYGDKYLYDGDSPYRPTAMRMGVKDITAASAGLYEDIILVRGEGFTPYSTVYAADKALDTVYVDAGMLLARTGLLASPESGDSVTVCQVSEDGTVLSAASPIPLETK